ncbi:probable serine/threonine-protein kinase kinY [Copidosoma floridanum]|uniref:probable serine/threonine-protein kinase kinY n=1 Tax=Copidosoma floridanum TaxID=29053 RepID=UPI0006C9879A|nr:probable serine/threonine-protein kinase kinY [Copidosoma floridanum]
MGTKQLPFYRDLNNNIIIFMEMKTVVLHQRNATESMCSESLLSNLAHDVTSMTLFSVNDCRHKVKENNGNNFNNMWINSYKGRFINNKVNSNNNVDDCNEIIVSNISSINDNEDDVGIHNDNVDDDDDDELTNVERDWRDCKDSLNLMDIPDVDGAYILA